MHPPPPHFDGLRLASPADILRLGVVATCGFRYSSVFDWECLYHEDYPEDTILAYRQHFSEFIKRTDYIVLVVEDKFEPDESKKSKAIIAQDDVAPRPEPGEEVIVGVACWQLWPGSHRRGQFQNNNGSYPDLPESKNRDKNLGHGQLLARTLGAAEHKHLPGLMTSLEWLVVHPAYWRRGHATRLAQWGVKLSILDHINQGVIAEKMAVDLYHKLGYKHIEDVDIKGEDIVPTGLSVSLMEYVVEADIPGVVELEELMQRL